MGTSARACASSTRKRAGMRACERACVCSPRCLRLFSYARRIYVRLLSGYNSRICVDTRLGSNSSTIVTSRAASCASLRPLCMLAMVVRAPQCTLVILARAAVDSSEGAIARVLKQPLGERTVLCRKVTGNNEYAPRRSCLRAPSQSSTTLHETCSSCLSSS